jgi:hypothetical protein
MRSFYGASEDLALAREKNTLANIEDPSNAAFFNESDSGKIKGWTGGRL